MRNKGGTVVGENPDHVCWVNIINYANITMCFYDSQSEVKVKSENLGD